MGILKAISNTGKSKASLRNLMSYVGEKAEETMGYNCSSNYEVAIGEFMQTKKAFEKEQGRQYKHYVMSFKEGEITGDKALDLANKFIEKNFPENEVLSALHTDKSHIHVHIVLNSVNCYTGEKYHESKKDLENLKKSMNELAIEYNLEIPKKEENKTITWNKEKYHTLKKDNSDIGNLSGMIEKISKKSTSKDTFIEEMKENGYLVDWKTHKKNITFTIEPGILQGKKNKFRLSNLEKTFNNSYFSRENLEKVFKENRKEKPFEMINGITGRKISIVNSLDLPVEKFNAAAWITEEIIRKNPENIKIKENEKPVEVEIFGITKDRKPCIVKKKFYNIEQLKINEKSINIYKEPIKEEKMIKKEKSKGYER